MKEKIIIEGFSKLSKEEKIKAISEGCINPDLFKQTLESFTHKKPEIQQIFDELIENTISNFHFPFAIAPNFVINNNTFSTTFGSISVDKVNKPGAMPFYI